MAERLRRNDREKDEPRAFDPVAEGAAHAIPAHVARQLWRDVIAQAGDAESDVHHAVLRFRAAIGQHARAADDAYGEPGKRARTTPPRVAAEAVVARAATGAIAAPTERALELAARSSGRRLSLAMQHRFAYLFDHGFEHVELHTDGAARQACEAFAARGFTLGSHVYVALDDTELETPAGGDLLMHELAHVVQHDRGQLVGPPRVTEPDDWVERAAHHLVEATKPRREQPRAETRSRQAPRASTRAGVPEVIARDALGTLHGTDLALDIDEGGVSVHVLVPLTPAQAQRFQADPNLARQLAQDFARTLVPAGRPRFESREFLESTAVTNRVTRDLDVWLSGGGLPQTTTLLDQRAAALGRLNLLAPLERALAQRGFAPGSIDWTAVGPALLAWQPPRAARTLVEASLHDRYYLFIRAIMTEAAARPSVVGATATAAQLSPVLHDYVDHLDRSAFGDGVSIFSEAFLAKWALDVQALRYTPEGFDVERFRPTTSAATLEAERTRVLDDFKRTRMPNLIVAYVRDRWSASMQTEEGFLAHVDMAALRQDVVARMVEEFMRLAAEDPQYRAALRSAAHDQARFDAVRTLFTLATAMERANQDLVQRVTTTPIDQLGPGDLEIADDPAAYYRTAHGVSQATLAIFTTLSRGGDLAAAFAALPERETAAIVQSATALIALVSHLRAIRSLRDQQRDAAREDLRVAIDLRYDDVVHIVQTMWDDAEAYIRDIYIPKLKEVAVRILTQNRDELARWNDNWDTETPRTVATYRIAAMGLDDVARRLRSGEATSVELNGQLLEVDDVAQVENAAKTLRGLAQRLESREGADEKRRQLREAIEAFDRTRARILDGTYPPYSWGPAVSSVARQELGIGEFPEYATYGMVFTGRVQASRNPFLARAIAGWQFRERLEAEFRQVAVFVGLGLVTVASILVPGVGGLVLTAIDIIANVYVAGSHTVDAYRALDLALLDPNLQLQGISVEQARTAVRHAWVGLALSLLIPAGIAGFAGVLIFRAGRAARQFARELPHLHALHQTDPVRLERLMRAVPDWEALNRLVGAANDARRLETMLFHSGNDAVALERLLRRVPDTVKLAGWLEHAGTLERMVVILDRTADAAQVDALAAAYSNRFLELEAHLAIVGNDARAGTRLLALLEHTGGPPGFARMLEPIGTAAEQTAFLRAIDSNPAQGVALARAMASTPGLAGRLARLIGNDLITHLTLDGASLRLYNELTIAPVTLASYDVAELPVLLRACQNPATHTADIARFEGGTYRLRFHSRINAKVDSWVTGMLRDAGYAEGSPQHALFQNLSDAEKAQMWDLPTNRGRDPDVRRQAARWALERQHSSVHQFVADFQFYVGEVSQHTERITAQLRDRCEGAVSLAEIAKRDLLTDAERQRIYMTELARPVNHGGLGHPFPNLTGKGVKRAIRELAIEQMGGVTATGQTRGAIMADAAAEASVANMSGTYALGTTQVAGAIDEATLPARVRAQVNTLHFGDQATAAYHAHVHTPEISRPDRIDGANEIETYLNTAREAVRSGTPSPVTRRQDGAWSITFSRGRGIVVVNVSPQGIATIATYIPAATS